LTKAILVRRYPECTMCSRCTYLLIMTCSQRKRLNPELLPALERYDGVHFRVLRKARREGYCPDHLDVLIISAKYGLLELDTAIKYYDLRMTLAQARRLRPTIVPHLAQRIQALPYTEIFLNVSKVYSKALEDWERALRRDTRVLYASGGMGQRAQQMRNWLMEKAMTPSKELPISGQSMPPAMPRVAPSRCQANALKKALVRPGLGAET
jgi:hypothetical protein